MAITVADSFINTPPSTSCSVSGFSVGDLAVVVASEFRDSGPAMDTPSDSAGNTYNLRQQNPDDGTFRSTCMIAEGVITTSPPTTISVGNAQTIVVLRVTGQDVSPYDVGNRSEVSGDDPAFPTLTPTVAGLVVLGLTHDGGDVSLDPPATYTLAKELESTLVNPIIAVYKAVAAGAQSGNWVTGGARDYAMVSAAYKEGATSAQNQLAWIVA